MPDPQPDSPDDQSVEAPSSSSEPTPRHPPQELLSKTTTDEQEIGWGDAPSEYSDEWYLAERPPHHQ